MSGVTDTSIFRLLREIDQKALALARLRRSRRERPLSVLAPPSPSASVPTWRSPDQQSPIRRAPTEDSSAPTVSVSGIEEPPKAAAHSIRWIPGGVDPDVEDDQVTTALMTDPAVDRAPSHASVSDEQPPSFASNERWDNRDFDDEIGARQNKLYALAQKIVAMFGKAPFKSFFGIKDKTLSN